MENVEFQVNSVRVLRKEEMRARVVKKVKDLFTELYARVYLI